jgi:hypothetical protein
VIHGIAAQHQSLSHPPGFRVITAIAPNITEVAFFNSISFSRSNEGSGKLRARFINTTKLMNLKNVKITKSMNLKNINITTPISPQFGEISSSQKIFTDHGNFLKPVALWREDGREGKS